LCVVGSTGRAKYMTDPCARQSICDETSNPRGGPYSIGDEL
jgi:hypothetical protein